MASFQTTFHYLIDTPFLIVKTGKVYFPTKGQSDDLWLDRGFDGVVANELIKKPPEADKAWVFS